MYNFNPKHACDLQFHQFVKLEMKPMLNDYPGLEGQNHLFHWFVKTRMNLMLGGYPTWRVKIVGFIGL